MEATAEGSSPAVRLGARLQVVEEGHLPGRRLNWHAHDRALLSIVLTGVYREDVGREQFDLRKLDVMRKPPQARHRDAVGRSGARSLLIGLAVPAEGPLGVVRCLPPARLRGPRVARLVAGVVTEWANRDPLSAIALEALILELFVATGRESGGETSARAPAALRRATSFINDSFDRHLSLEDIAAVAGVHPAHLGRMFRRAFGCSIGHYLRSTRTEAAARWLSTTDSSLASVAVRAGFYDQSHMGRCVRARYGCTPLELRQRGVPATGS